LCWYASERPYKCVDRLERKRGKTIKALKYNREFSVAFGNAT